MTVDGLRDLCVDAIGRFERGEMFSERPFIGLTLIIDRVPTGNKIRLSGRFGPYGDIANTRRLEDDKIQVMAYFNAQQVLNWIEKHS